MSSAIRRRLEPQTGIAFELKEGQRLCVIDCEGEQVSDLICYDRKDPREWLSSGRSLDYNETVFLTKGHRLYSNRSNVMMTIEEDTVGRHDFLLTPCSQETFEIIYDHKGHHPSCFENLFTNLASYGIEPDHIPTTFNIFMNVELSSAGKISVLPPLSKAGDKIILRAERGLIVGLTACSAEMSNNYKFKPIEFEIYDS